MRGMDGGVSFCIPAYNNPSYLKKAVESILCQSYRPIEIIVVDDNSPSDLTSLMEDFESRCDLGVKWIFQRNSLNLGPYWNIKSCLEKATLPYLVIMPHDDWFIDNNAIASAVEVMVTNESVYVVLANSRLENSVSTNFDSEGAEKWKFIDGNDFLVSNLYSDLHPAYSAIVMDRKKLYSLGFLDLWLTHELSKRSEVIPDEGFISVALLASEGKVAVSGKVISIRGNPTNSYSKSLEWDEKSGIGVFYPNYRLYRYFRKKRNFRLTLFYLKLCITYYPITKIGFNHSLAMENRSLSTLLLISNLCYSTIRRARYSLKHRVGRLNRVFRFANE